MSLIDTVRSRAEKRGAKFIANASDATLRRLAGKPIVIEGQTLDPAMQLIIKALDQQGHSDWTTLGPEASREQATREGAARDALPKTEVATVRELEVEGAEGPVRARLYRPHNLTEDPAPALHYIHGGGYVIGDLDTHDELCRLLADRAGVVVISTEYRLAPEHHFPAGVMDSYFAFSSIAERSEEFRIDPKRIAIGGDSAGGNHAAVVSLMCREAGGPRPALQLLIYPGTDFKTSKTWASREKFNEGFFLVEGDIEGAAEFYAPDVDDPRASPLHAKSHDDLPPAYVVSAGFDPIRDEGEAYAAKLIEDGTRAALRRHPSLIHGFANMTQVSRTAKSAIEEAAGAVRMGLAMVGR